MNVDAPLPHLPFAALPGRPVATRSEQASARPVERPHHDEPANNQTRQDARTTEAQQENRQPAAENRPFRQESELSPEEKRKFEHFRARDREVRAHEAPGLTHTTRTDLRIDHTDPARIGELIDVTA